jgi:HD-like signal output (HDOD) protein
VKWKFPHDFARVIRGHHGSHGPDQQDPLLRTVNASDRFFTRTLSGQSTEAFILDKERGAIVLEVEKIMEFLQLG